MRIESWVGVTAVLLLMFGGAMAADEQQRCRRSPLARECRHAARSRASDTAHLRSLAGVQGAVRSGLRARTTCASEYGLTRRFQAAAARSRSCSGRVTTSAPTCICRRRNGLTELLGHEFEHLIEQIEGLDLKRLARVKGSGVHEVEGQRVRDRSRAGGGTRRRGRSASPPHRRVVTTGVPLETATRAELPCRG